MGQNVKIKLGETAIAVLRRADGTVNRIEPGQKASVFKRALVACQRRLKHE